MKDYYNELRGKTILVSGATGMIGSQVVKTLLGLNLSHGLNLRVVALYRNETKKRQVFDEEVNNESVLWVQSDITERVEIAQPIDYIIHTAGVTGGSFQHVKSPMTTIDTAIEGTRNMLSLAKDKGVKGFVFLSTLEVYGNTDFNLPSIKETDGGYIDPMAVRSSYPESKRMCETICAAYMAQYAVPAKVVRLTATYGKGASYHDNRVMCDFAKCIIEKRDIVLHSYGETVRNYCDVDDAVEAILCVLIRGEVGQAYNIANMDTEISIADLAKKFIEIYPEANSKLVYDIPKDVTKLGYNQTRKIRLDSAKLQALGWEPQVGIDGIISNLVGAMRNSKEKEERV